LSPRRHAGNSAKGTKTAQANPLKNNGYFLMHGVVLQISRGLPLPNVSRETFLRKERLGRPERESPRRPATASGIARILILKSA
jgi:hypothetical protein